MADLRLNVSLWPHASDTPRISSVGVPLAPMTSKPDAESPLTSQLIFGERFQVHHRTDGWAFGVGEDGYVGWTPEAALESESFPNQKVRALNAVLYIRPDMKSRPVAALPFGAAVEAGEAKNGFCPLSCGGWAPEPHLAPLGAVERDWVAVAKKFLGAPYLWGGRSPAGIDCSGLIQAARRAAGFACARDSDLQCTASGRNVATLKRGDLIFWKGHVGVMLSPTRLLHANAHHMAVVAEPLVDAEARIAAAGGGPVIARRRWPARANKETSE